MALVLGVGLALAGSLGAVQDFEAGLGGWTPAGLWHRVAGPACFASHSGSASLYFGRDSQCNYADGQLKDQVVLGAPVAITDAARAVMSFWLLSQVESLDPSCYDQLWLEISDDGGATWSVRDLSPGVSPAGGSPGVGLASGSGLGGAPQWTYLRVDLSVYLGLTILPRFRFLSSAKLAGDNSCGPPDSAFDNFLGYAIDDIAIHEEPCPVTLAKDASPAVAASGSTVTYALRWSNVGPGPATLALWDTLPTGLSFVGSTPAPSLVVGSRFEWSLPGQAAGASGSVTVLAAVTATSPGDLYNQAGASSSGATGVFLSPQSLLKVRNPGLSLRKSVSPGTVTVGDRITFTLILENNAPVAKAALSLEEQLPSGFVMRGAYPAFNRSSGWDLGTLGPGQVRSFTLWGEAFGEDGQVFTNRAVALVSGAQEAEASASYTMVRPAEPQITVKALYPNPAPSGKPGLPQSAFVVYELNQAMPVGLEVYTINGELVRRLEGASERGVHQIEWDLKNSWGNDVASGVYLIRLSSTLEVLPKPEAVGYLAVVR